jgi:hypothetical protein
VSHHDLKEIRFRILEKETRSLLVFGALPMGNADKAYNWRDYGITVIDGFLCKDEKKEGV